MAYNSHSTADEAKAIVALAFRNGPIENVHAGTPCPSCSGNPAHSGITQSDMKNIMKTAVDRVYSLLKMRDEQPDRYRRAVQVGLRSTMNWDEPQDSQP